ncbi:MAG: type-F conjugative transfer system pilin assembly protein TrbC [uncultured bacterium]|nr:MAG: type-F conjugative transfer system pilin assembly protein TrbC [uncultured bacterium]
MNFLKSLLFFCAAMLWAIPSHAQKVYIDTPNPCHAIEKITGHRVDLKSPEKKDCIQTVGRAEVEIPDDKITEIEVWIDGKFWKKQPIQKFNMTGISKRLDQSSDLAGKLEVPKNKFADQGLAQAQLAADKFNSPEFQAKITKEKDRLSKEVFGDIIKEYYPDSQKKEPAKTPGEQLEDTERIYVFFSKSMPEHTLRNYISMISKAQDPNITMVMRGFIGEGLKKMKPTLNYIRELRQKDPNCNPIKAECDLYSINIIIDPLLFQRYHVETVPMVVFARGVISKNGDSERNESEGNPEKADVGQSFEISGDAPLDYMLERINAEAKRPTLEGTIAKMRSGFYGQAK